MSLDPKKKTLHFRLFQRTEIRNGLKLIFGSLILSKLVAKRERTYKFREQNEMSTVNLPWSFPFFPLAVFLVVVAWPLIIFLSNAAKAHFSYFETKFLLMGFTKRNVYTDALCGSSAAFLYSIYIYIFFLRDTFFFGSLT